MSSNQEEYEVQRIVAKRTKKNATWYCVKWVGYHQSENTWEPIEYLANAPEKIKEFEESKLKKKKTSNKAGSQVKQSKDKNRSIKLIEESKRQTLLVHEDKINSKSLISEVQTENMLKINEKKTTNDEFINLISDSSKFSDNDNKSNHDNHSNLGQLQHKEALKDQAEAQNPNETGNKENKQYKNSIEQKSSQLLNKLTAVGLNEKYQGFSSRSIIIKQVVKLISEQSVVLFESKGKKYKSSLDIIKKYHSQDLQSFFDKQMKPVEMCKFQKNDDQK